MNVNIKEFLEESEIPDSLYPGKRVVKPCKHTGEFKSHCVVFDWRNPEELLVEVKPSLTGKHLAPENLKPYPVCFQMPTYVKIAVTNDNDEDEEDEKEGRGGKSSGSGGGGRKPAKRKLEDIELIAARFGSSAEGKAPVLGKITDMMVMGVKIAKEAFTATFAELGRQIKQAKVSATEIPSKSGSFVKRVQPPSYVTPKGDETVKYRYDRMKNADIGLKNPSL
jgi:hypothetical protein